MEKLDRGEQRRAVSTTCDESKIEFKAQILYVDRVGCRNIVPPCVVEHTEFKFYDFTSYYSE